MLKNFYYYLMLLTLGLAGLMSSCKKPLQDGSAALTFSTPLVNFDTLFTTVSSANKSFTVYNLSDKNVKVNVYLASGSSSFFSINVNGVPGNSHHDVEIPAKDSIFVFVKANINPGNQNQPFLITDSVIFENQYHKQDVDLMAYGQDAHFIVADAATGMNILAHENETVTWTNDKPYVVYGGWAVVDSLGTLNIEAGTRIYFHRNSGLLVWRYGNIHVNGTLEQPVVFQGDRLEAQYAEATNQWNRIWILEGEADNTIDYAIIKNSFVGLQIEPWGGFESITVTDNHNVISNTIIENTYNSGLIARYANIDATNCVIANNGGCSVQLEAGNYDFKHVTIANYYAGTPKRQNPALYLSNAAQIYQLPYQTQASFVNCIVYGNLSSGEELLIQQDPSATLDYRFENCLLRSAQSGTPFVNCHSGSPEFVNTASNDYHLDVFSYAINRGMTGINVPYDLDGNRRTGIPDVGAYEFIR